MNILKKCKATKPIPGIKDSMEQEYFYEERQTIIYTIKIRWVKLGTVSVLEEREGREGKNFNETFAKDGLVDENLLRREKLKKLSI